MSDEFVDYEKMLEVQEEECLNRINNANSLEFMTRCEGWEILINSLEEKKQTQIEELVNLPPGNDEAVLRAHAVAFAVAHTVEDVSGSVFRAIQDGETAKRTLTEIRSQKNQDDQNGFEQEYN